MSRTTKLASKEIRSTSGRRSRLAVGFGTAVVAAMAMVALPASAGSGHVNDQGVKISKVHICVNGGNTMLTSQANAAALIGSGVATKGVC